METVLDNKKAPWGEAIPGVRRTTRQVSIGFSVVACFPPKITKKHEIVCTPELDTHS